MYRHEGRAAIHHLFRVAASLDSMVIGEPQILGQLKTAYAAAKDCGSVCGWLDGLMTRAFSVAKRVRTETEIGQMAVSVSYAAVELARKIFGSLNNRTVMIVGAGKMSELAARHLRRSGASHVFVTNRTHERAVEMAKLFQGTPVEYTRFVSMLPEVDIVITSSGAPHYILRKEEMQRVISARRNKPMFLIDIAVPRNIEPSVNDLDNVFLYDIDDLQEVVNANLRERMKEADHAEALVAEEVDRMMARLKVAEVTPLIVGLQEQLEQIRAAEMEKTRRKFGPFTPEQEQAMEALTRAIINKIAHGPISELRNHAGPPGRRARGRGHSKGVSPPGLIHACYRIARFAARPLAGPLGAGAAWRRWGTSAASKSSRPPATRSPTCRWRRSARRACSRRRSKRRCSTAAPIWPFTA